MADYLLLETGDKLILEDGSGDLILETAIVAIDAEACTFVLRNRYRQGVHAVAMAHFWSVTNDGKFEEGGRSFILRNRYRPSEHTISLGNMMVTAQDASIPTFIRGRRVGRERGLGARAALAE
jgi:hypothetical protein